MGTVEHIFPPTSFAEAYAAPELEQEIFLTIRLDRAKRRFPHSATMFDDALSAIQAVEQGKDGRSVELLGTEQPDYSYGGPEVHALLDALFEATGSRVVYDDYADDGRLIRRGHYKHHEIYFCERHQDEGYLDSIQICSQRIGRAATARLMKVERAEFERIAGIRYVDARHTYDITRKNFTLIAQGLRHEQKGRIGKSIMRHVDRRR